MMTQIAIVQPTAPQTQPKGPPPDSEQGSFSNHLEDALSTTAPEKRQPPDKAQGKKGNSTKAENSNSSSTSDEIASTDTKTKHADDISTDKKTDGNSEEKAQDTAEQNPAVSSSLLNNQLNLLTRADFDSLGNAAAKIKTATTDSPLTTLKNELLTKDVSSIPVKSEGEIPVADTKTSATPLASTTSKSSNSHQETLPAQLQQIIENSSETGIVSITKTGNSLTLHAGGIVTGNTTVTQLTGTDQVVTTISNSSEYDFLKDPAVELFNVNGGSEQSPHQLKPLRQNAHHQYYAAKITLQNIGNQKETTQKNQQDTDTAQQNSSSSLPGKESAATDSGNGFSLMAVNNGQTTTTMPVTELPPTTVLPSGLVVHEDDVIQQLTERFHVNRRQLDTRVNIKLHPAELGELNIGLTVKQGTIRAHVVAQSHHVQEIIEKHMTKLKTVLEDQGFSVAEISVTSGSESVGDFNLFDRQLFSDNDYSPQVKKRSRHTVLPFSLDEIKIESQSAATGVNVRI